MKNRIYYEPQSEWGADEYYYLHRVLHRILYYYEKNSEEIRSMDLSKMSDATKVLIYCIIKYYHFDFLFSINDDFEKLKTIQPLKQTLVIDADPLPEDNIYKQMNVMY